MMNLTPEQMAAWAQTLKPAATGNSDDNPTKILFVKPRKGTTMNVMLLGLVHANVDGTLEKKQNKKGEVYYARGKRNLLLAYVISVMDSNNTIVTTDSTQYSWAKYLYNQQRVTVINANNTIWNQISPLIAAQIGLVQPPAGADEFYVAPPVKPVMYLHDVAPTVVPRILSITNVDDRTYTISVGDALSDEQNVKLLGRLQALPMADYVEMWNNPEQVLAWFRVNAQKFDAIPDAANDLYSQTPQVPATPNVLPDDF